MSELTDFTGWVGFILISLCLVRFLSGISFIKGFISKPLEYHKGLGWLALVFLAGHGLIAYYQESPELPKGIHLFFSEIGTGLLTWLILLATCLTTLLLRPPSIFRKRHVLLVITLTLFALVHIE